MSSDSLNAVNFVIQEITKRTGKCPIGGIDIVDIAEALEQEFHISHIDNEKDSEE